MSRLSTKQRRARCRRRSSVWGAGAWWSYKFNGRPKSIIEITFPVRAGLHTCAMYDLPHYGTCGGPERVEVEES